MNAMAIMAAQYGATPEEQIANLKRRVEAREAERIAREIEYAAKLNGARPKVEAKEPIYKKQHGTLQDKIVSAFAGRMTAPQIQNKLGRERNVVTSGGVASSLRALEDKGIVERVGLMPGTDKNGKPIRPVTVWRLVGEAAQ